MYLRFFFFHKKIENARENRCLKYRMARAIGVSEDFKKNIESYLLDSLRVDFPRHEIMRIIKLLEDIERLERDEISELFWDGQDIQYTIRSENVTFEHTVFGVCPEWPLWACSLAQFKAILTGWSQFIAMPESTESELVVEVPDV